jgi:mono/diheme cytochrome c family protein
VWPGRERPIREVENRVYAIRDRCVTCHAATEQEAPGPGPSAHRFHSPALLEAHPVGQLGCAVCHGGDPLATVEDVAHGRGDGAAGSLLTGLSTQSRCGRCHEDLEIEGTETLRKGLALIDERACFACHEIPGGARRARRAPTLDHVAHKVHADWLIAWLMDPKSYFKSARMPSYYLTEPEAVSIAAYLTTLAGPPPPGIAPNAAKELDRAEARRLLKRSACLDCHRMRGAGGAPPTRAPDLSRIGDKVKASWLVRWIQGPQHLQPGAGMPAFRFTDAQAVSIARYLTETFTSRRREERTERELPTEPQRIEEGRQLIEELGCMNCHGGRGEKPVLKMGPDLREVGDRDARAMRWGEGDEDAWSLGLASYLRAKISTPRAFSPHHRMPYFAFTPDETEAIVVALLSFSRNPIPAEARLRAPEVVRRLAGPSGTVGEVFERYQCLECHALRGGYGELAPDLGWQGDKVHREWLVRYLKEPYPIRPGLDARMPDFGMTDQEIELVVDYIEASWWDDEVPPDPFDGEPPPAELAERGRELVRNVYSCLDCHEVQGEGEEDGPALDEAGDRLQPGWTYQWVLDPQRFYENDMGEEEVSEADALALTAYLMSLRSENPD